jgi:DNA-binding CsgD family transcriptional regulator
MVGDDAGSRVATLPEDDGGGPPAVGREAEVGALARCLETDAATTRGHVALLVGEPGIGKTTLWHAGRTMAARRGFRCLAARPVEAEARLPHSCLVDLLEPVGDEILPELPDPQRRALDTILLRAGSAGSPLDRLTVATAVSSAIRRLADRGPLLIAVDDLHWLDGPSAHALRFAVRRIADVPVVVLGSVRIEPGIVDPLELGSTPAATLTHLRLRPMTPGELGRLLAERLGLVFERTRLMELHRIAAGNPFYALQIGAEIVASGGDDARCPLPLPDGISAAARAKLARLPEDTRDALLLLAVTRASTSEELDLLLGPEAMRRLDPAVRAGVVVRDEGRFRVTHPLLASALERDAEPAAARSAHGRIADVVSDPVERARHAALAAERPSDGVSAELERAAGLAFGRGAPETAIELAEFAIRLTPIDRSDLATDRRLLRASFLMALGSWLEAERALRDVLEDAPDATRRARAHLGLGRVLGYLRGWPHATEQYGLALAAVGDDVPLRSEIHRDASFSSVAIGDFAAGLTHAHEAMRFAEESGDEALVLFTTPELVMLDFFAGRGAQIDRIAPLVAVEDSFERLPIFQRPRHVLGGILHWCDDLDGGRAVYEELLDRLEQLGQVPWIPYVVYHLVELECWAGNLERADELARLGLSISAEFPDMTETSPQLYADALVAAYRGEESRARGSLVGGFQNAQSHGNVAMLLQLASVAGFLDLSLGNLEAVDASLGAPAAAAIEMGLGEPGVVHWLPDQIEALVALGELDRARRLTDLLEERGAATGRRWAIATGARSRALLLAAEGDLDAAVSAIGAARSAQVDLPYPVECARTELVAGDVLIRARQVAGARQAYDAAVEAFERVGTPWWAARARAARRRVGGRAPAGDRLTETELQVAVLAANGSSNREIAERLFVSPRTVESHLSAVYRKLAIRSRTQLASVLVAQHLAEFGAEGVLRALGLG